MIKNNKVLDEIYSSIWNDIPSLVYEDEFEEYDESNGFRMTRKMVIPEQPLLNNILKWHSLNNRNKYSHFEIIKSEAYFVIYESDETYKMFWNLEYSTLDKQSEELINWLYTLI